MFLASSTFRCLRPTVVDTDDTGDPVDRAPVAIWDHRPGLIEEVSRVVPSPAGTSLVRLGILSGQFRPGTDVALGDLIVDERSGATFAVTDVRRPMRNLIAPDVMVDLSSAAPYSSTGA